VGVMRVLGIVPARGGSKGVPRKNIQLVNGKPLLQYTAEAALQTKRLSRVILTTEDEEIADIGRRCGLEVLFLRPLELAADDTPTLPVLQHAVGWLEERDDRYGAVCLLQPTTPMRSPEDIDGCIALLESKSIDSVITVRRVPDEYNPHWVYFEDGEGCLHLSTGSHTPITRRQALPPAYHRDGSVYVTRRNVLMDENSLYGKRVSGYAVGSDCWVNIDTPEDLEQAAIVLGARV
jgi:CMP-N,N'-diacetyllegionaminic acid synthase